MIDKDISAEVRTTPLDGLERASRGKGMILGNAKTMTRGRLGSRCMGMGSLQQSGNKRHEHFQGVPPTSAA